jgi:hypothetical protein
MGILPTYKTLLTALLLLAFLGGCSANRMVVQDAPVEDVSPVRPGLETSYWWKCEFKIVWPEETDADWGMDLLLAHAVISPVLTNHSQELFYWRFHRRAARDNFGHRFSFLFYSTPETAASVFTEVRQSPVLHAAISQHHVQKVSLGDPGNPQRPDIEDTSDKSWSPKLQRSWPLYIMGVSALWLGLIDEHMAETGSYTDFDTLLARYREVDEQITDTWRTEGQHAFLHHLNAMFGYDPLYLRKMLSF